MIISEFKPGRTIADTDQIIQKIVKGRIQKMSNETIDEIDAVIRHLMNIRQNYKPILLGHPEIDHDLSTQINELKRLNQGIKKEVE